MKDRCQPHREQRWVVLDQRDVPLHHGECDVCVAVVVEALPRHVVEDLDAVRVGNVKIVEHQRLKFCHRQPANAVVLVWIQGLCAACGKGVQSMACR